MSQSGVIFSSHVNLLFLQGKKIAYMRIVRISFLKKNTNICRIGCVNPSPRGARPEVGGQEAFLPTETAYVCLADTMAYPESERVEAGGELVSVLCGMKSIPGAQFL